MKNKIFNLAQETDPNSPMKKSLQPGMKTGMKAPMKKGACNRFEDTAYASLVFNPRSTNSPTNLREGLGS